MQTDATHTTSLDTLETKCSIPHTYYEARHTDVQEREAALSAISQIDCPDPKRIQRFTECGSKTWILRHKERDEYRLAGNFCRDRFCPACQKDYRRRIRRTLDAQLLRLLTRHTTKPLSLLTVTIRSSKAPLRKQISFLKRAWTKLRRRSFFANACDGGISALEITYNPATDEWHPHLHMVLISTYIPQKTLSRVWKSITKTSMIIDIRRINDHRQAIRYITKYISKPITLTDLPQHRRIEAVMHLKGVQLYSKWGLMRNVKIPDIHEDDYDPRDWEIVDTVDNVLSKARAGDERSIAILRSIHLLRVDPTVERSIATHHLYDDTQFH